MAIRRPASKIVWVALLLGACLIFASSMVRELRQDREERACSTGDLAACGARCTRGSDAACAELERQCGAGIALACEAKSAVKGARRRGTRW